MDHYITIIQYNNESNDKLFVCITIMKYEFACRIKDTQISIE